MFWKYLYPFNCTGNLTCVGPFKEVFQVKDLLCALEIRSELMFSLLQSCFGRNISPTSARVSSGVPNTEKQMKARSRRPGSAFIVSR